MKLADRALARSASRTPIRNAVAKAWPEITEARAAGASLNAIFRELKADGQNVGASYSSFRNAVRYLDDNAPDAVGQTHGKGVTPEARSSTNADQNRFADRRHDSDWGEK
ncbi:hypothetical protein AAG614_03805 [Citromicrobium bathyomarinum]